MFEAALFRSPTYYEENLFVDRKRDMYQLYSKDNRKKAEFIRDVIAMANTARRFGKPTRLLFGIDDEGKIVGICDEVSQYGDPQDVTTWESIRHQIAQLLKSYISPPPEHILEHGIIDGRHVAYLEIHPTTTPSHYKVKKGIKARKGGLHEGQAWIRYGESNEEIQVQEISETDSLSVSHADIPYIFPRDMKEYLDNVLRDRHIIESINIAGYQELYSTTGKLLIDEVHNFLNSEWLRILFIVGEAGIGKTSFVRRMVFQLSEDGANAAESYIQENMFTLPDVHVPVFIPLWSTQTSEITRESIESKIFAHITRNLGRRYANTNNFQGLLRCGIKWVVFFDGLDEIWSNERQRLFVQSIDELSQCFTDIRIIITGRPRYVPFAPSTRSGWKTVQVRPFSEQQIKDFILSLSPSMDPSEYETICDTILENSDLRRICSFPAFLIPALKELLGITVYETFGSFTDSYITAIERTPYDRNAPRVGIILHDIYSHVWTRESQRRGISRDVSSSWWKATGSLAINACAYGKPFSEYAVSNVTERAQVCDVEKLIFWLLNINVLEEYDYVHPRRFSFFTALTQSYFAASLISAFLENPDLAPADVAEAVSRLKDCSEDFRKSVESVLREISSHYHGPHGRGGAL